MSAADLEKNGFKSFDFEGKGLTQIAADKLNLKCDMSPCSDLGSLPTQANKDGTDDFTIDIARHMRPELQLIALLLCAGDGRTPELSRRLTAPRAGTRTVEQRDGGTFRTEHWAWKGKRVERVFVTTGDGEQLLEGVDTNGDLLVDEETVSTFGDAGITEQVSTRFPLDGGLARFRSVSTALGGNRRHIDEQQWLDGGWQSTREYDGTWRDERHLR